MKIRILAILILISKITVLGASFRGLGDLPGNSFQSYAFEISADGSTVVGIGNSSLGYQAFRWTSSGGMVGLGDLPGGGFRSEAYDVSSDGSVVVGMGWMDLGHEAFRWTTNDGMIGLGNIHNGNVSNSAAYGVSADGSAIVGYCGGEAFYWTSSEGMRSLKDILTNDCKLDLTGWQLEWAHGISADGMTIVGQGFNPNGDKEAWVATIPEPATLLLLGLGAVMLRRKR